MFVIPPSLNLLLTMRVVLFSDFKRKQRVVYTFFFMNYCNELLYKTISHHCMLFMHSYENSILDNDWLQSVIYTAMFKKRTSIVTLVVSHFSCLHDAQSKSLVYTGPAHCMHF